MARRVLRWFTTHVAQINRPPSGWFSLLRSQAQPLELQIVGRTLFHALLVGAAAGVVGAAFFAALEYLQSFLLEGLAGYHILRAHGELFVEKSWGTPFRPWLLLLLPAAGALLGGWLSGFAPETQGGGGDAMIEAFHHQGGVVRARVLWVKLLSSLATLASGGAGGREGPTMQIGAALGSTVGRLLKVTTRERRILMLAGVAAGISAVFRTPLGAALLAVEVLYHDDFEGDALVPAVLASVMAYSVVISIYGESTLFARAPRYPFYAEHLVLYAILALLVALVAAGFIAALRTVQHISSRLPLPAWVRPGTGGLLLGLFSVPVIFYVGGRIGIPGQGLGILGGGYGAAQMAITGESWLPGGWGAVSLLLLLCGAKLIASSLTIGTGGSAGDFAPSLVLGGLLGGAFGRMAQLLLHDPRIDPGAFALVGMGVFYGGIAHVPLSALIFVSELAGSYDLLVPLMLANGIAFIALRNLSLYTSQVRSKHQSPVHRRDILPEVLRVAVRDLMLEKRPFVSFTLRTPVSEILARVGDDNWQDSFPVVDEHGKLRGLVPLDDLRYLAGLHESAAWTIAADLMHPAVSVKLDDDLRSATMKMLANNLREIAVVDDDGKILGLLDEQEAAKAYVNYGDTHQP
jgi:CIC family chloride channel protein